MEQLQYNSGPGIDDPVWVPTVFTKNRDRLLITDIARNFLVAILAHKDAAPRRAQRARAGGGRFAVVAIGLAALRWCRQRNRQERRRGRLRFGLRSLLPAKQKVGRDPVPARDR